MLDKRGMDGDSIQVGIVGGEQALRDRPLTYLERRRWKWRETANAGKVVRNNWIAGDRFVELIEDRRRQDTETPER